MGYTDKVISTLCGKPEAEIKKLREENNIIANFKMVDTCAAEFDASTPYYYSSYDEDDESLEETGKKSCSTRFWTN